MKNNSIEKTNLFKEYRKAEDAVTKGLAKFLDEHEHFNEKFFERIETEVPIEPKVILQSTEDGSRPDIKILSKNMVVYVESKLKTRLRQNQCKAQLNDLKKEKPENRIFLLISLWKKEYSFLDTYERENPEIDFCYLDWRDIYRIADDLSDEHENTLDSSAADYLLNEYKEKLLKGEKVEAFTGLDSEEIKLLEDGNIENLEEKYQFLREEIIDNLGDSFCVSLTGDKGELIGEIVKTINGKFTPFIIFDFLSHIKESMNEDEPETYDDDIEGEYTPEYRQYLENLKNELRKKFLAIGEEEKIISKLNSLKEWYIISDGEDIKCEEVKSFNQVLKLIDSVDWVHGFHLVKFYTFSDFKSREVVKMIIKEFNEINFLR